MIATDEARQNVDDRLRQLLEGRMVDQGLQIMSTAMTGRQALALARDTGVECVFQLLNVEAGPEWQIDGRLIDARSGDLLSVIGLRSATPHLMMSALASAISGGASEKR